jgi:hypothetical protein
MEISTRKETHDGDMLGDRREDYEYNGIERISHLRHEIITDKSSSYHDSLFKIIIIGDTGKLTIIMLMLLIEQYFRG